MQAEYPDTTWAGLPRWFSTGRDGKTPTLSVIHYTAGSESRSSAENGAAYDKTRPSQVSCHCFHDPDSSVQELPRAYRAYSAFSKGNRLGIHHELCGTAQTRAQWLDEASDAILWRAARAVAKDCVDFNLEPRLLSVAEVRASWYSYPNGPRGICGHVHITKAFPEDGGDHTDPGPDFPWDIFIARVRHYLAPITSTQNHPEEDEDMNSVVYVRRNAPAGEKQLWALAGPAVKSGWVETDNENTANGWAGQFMKTGNSVDVDFDDWAKTCSEHRGASA